MASSPENQTPEEAILAKIEKMLRHADGNVNESEAANALALAQKLADAYSIDIEGLRQRGVNTGDTKARDDKSFSGGLYPYQRTLYNAIAKLNHCLYWTKKGTEKGQKFEHRLVGSKLNVLLAKQMGDYLGGTVERLAKEYAGHHSEFFTKRTHAFREGVIDRVVEKINDKRYSDAREAKEKAEAFRRANPGAQNALATIDDVSQREAEANYDFQWGEGAWAQRKARQAEWAAEQRLATEAAAKWEIENPTAAAEKKAEQAQDWADYLKKEARRAARSRSVGPRRAPAGRKIDAEGYYAGRDAGANVGLDRQVDRAATQGRLK